MILDYMTIFYIPRKTLLKKRKEEKRQRDELAKRREHLIDYYKATQMQLICELAFIGKSLYSFLKTLNSIFQSHFYVLCPSWFYL